MNFLPLHLGDFFKHIAGMSPNEVGVYCVLALHLAHTEEPLSPDRVYRIAGAHSEPDRAAVDAVRAEHFTRTAGGFVLPWVVEAIAQVHAKSAKAAESAAVRWAKQGASNADSEGSASVLPSHSERDADAMRSHNEGNANQYPVSSNQEPVTKNQEPELGTTKENQVFPLSAGSRKRKPVSDSDSVDQTTLAMVAYNRHLAKAPFHLPKATKVGFAAKREMVRKCADIARAMCQTLYQCPKVTAEFWDQYFKQIAHDPFLSGMTRPGPGHEGWRPDFEFLIRPKTMVRVFELSGAACDDDCPTVPGDRGQDEYDDAGRRTPDAGADALPSPAATPAPQAAARSPSPGAAAATAALKAATAALTASLTTAATPAPLKAPGPGAAAATTALAAATAAPISQSVPGAPCVPPQRIVAPTAAAIADPIIEGAV